MKIGELASKTACTVETIRYYEQQGLLPEPERTEGNYRDYGMKHLERLQFIRNCRSLDMAQEEIRSLLVLLDTPDEDCAGVNHVLDQHIVHVQERMRELKVLQQQLVQIRAKCTAEGGVRDCGILNDLHTTNVRLAKQKSHVSMGKDLHK